MPSGTVVGEAMHPNARPMPMVTALMVGLVAGTLARSALVAALAAVWSCS